MNTKLFERGSEWRKWDLHIHTPASFHWNGGKRLSEMTPQEQKQTFRKMLDKINNSDVAAFAITDYWTFDGYLKFKKYIEDNNLSLNKTIFPGMELRVEAPVDYRLNTQVILSDELKPQQLQDFKSKLKIGLIDRPLSDDALIEFAKTLDDSKAKTNGYDSPLILELNKLLELGSKTAVITKESLCKDAFGAIPKNSGYILLPYDTSDGLKDLDWATHPHDDNYFMQSAHIFESRNDESINLFLAKETENNKGFIKNFIKTIGGEPKPVVSGSDAHKIEDYGKYPNNKITWIKSDPIFQGLKQVINEPRERSFIGILPPKLVSVTNNKSKYIDSVEISHCNPSATPSWFNTQIPLNTGLVTVIGKKGSGKSALADIISLCGNCRINPKDYSFLTHQKFRKRGLAKQYEVNLRWLDKKPIKKNLDAEVDLTTSIEGVKYLPQQYVETICNDDGVSYLFQQEIDKVIFSYVPKESTLSTSSLSELIDKKTESINDNLLALRNDLRKLNINIVNLEEKESPSYIDTLKTRLEQKKRELKNLNKPKPVKKPIEKISKTKERKIGNLTQSIESINKLIISTRQELGVVNTNIHKLRNIKSSASDIRGRIEKFIETFNADAKVLSIDLKKVIKISIADDILQKKETELAKKKSALENRLEQNNPKSTASLYNKKNELEIELKAITSTLDSNQKFYKEYLQKIQEYDQMKLAIEGKKDDPGLDTTLSIEAELQYVKNQLSKDLQSYYDKRCKLQEEIFNKLKQKTDFYQEVYMPLIKFIESEKETQTKAGNVLNFSAGFVFNKQKFIDDFFSFINQNRDGSFQGKIEGQRMLSKLIEQCDINKESSIDEFVSEILDYLRNDKTQKNPKANQIKIQLKKSQVEFYDFIFGLQYLDVKYKILFNGKDLNANEFSPGEKGALLLIFYLLIDKESIPLIIDQPEENLDNESVYTLLVPYIKRAKKRRQIIAVTHNPNLAVVCDAEQVICAKMDKKKNEIRYISGSIENPEINKKIVDILEGTLPAFINRDRKYIKKLSD